MVHGTADPLFPPAHGRALAEAIPGARMIELEDVGHQLPPPHIWAFLVDKLGRAHEPGRRVTVMPELVPMREPEQA